MTTLASLIERHTRAILVVRLRSRGTLGLFFGGVLVKADEVAERDRKFDILRRVKRIEPECFLQAYNDESKTERIEPRIKEFQLVG
jgi:hypothetical protein